MKEKVVIVLCYAFIVCLLAGVFTLNERLKVKRETEVNAVVLYIVQNSYDLGYSNATNGVAPVTFTLGDLQ